FTASGATSTTISNAGLQVQNGGMATFAYVTTLTDSSLTANSGGVMLFPAATQFNGGANSRTVQALGPGSLINLSHLSGFGGAYRFVTASTGGEVNLGVEVTRSPITLSDASSKIDVSKVTSLIGTGVTATAG